MLITFKDGSKKKMPFSVKRDYIGPMVKSITFTKADGKAMHKALLRDWRAGCRPLFEIHARLYKPKRAPL